MMNEYSSKDITIGLEIEPHTELLRGHFGDNLLNTNYNTRLVYNQRNPELIQFTIYYKSADYLFEKFELLKNNGINILSIIKPKYNKHKWEHPEIIDFSNSKLLNIQESHHWEHNKKPVVLTIDNIEILVKESYVSGGRFQLTENVFQHLDKYIHYGLLGRHRPDDKFIEKDTNREINFGNSRFILSFEHWFGNSTKFNLDISRDAYLTMTDNPETLTDVELIELGNSLCLLMSFYWQKTIDFFNARVRINNKDNYRTREILKYSNHFVDESEDFILKPEFETFYDFIEFVNYDRFIKNLDLIKELVPRIIKTRNIDEISAFMILYNIIEKIRNHCMLFPVMGKELSIKEEFNFTKGKDATKKFIKTKIKEIGEIVVKPDIDAFLKKASDKVSFIKKTGLIDQFDNLINYLGLKVTDYDIEFINLIKIRNSIYHGKLPKEDVKPYNEQMIKLIYDMIMTLITDKNLLPTSPILHGANDCK